MAKRSKPKRKSARQTPRRRATKHPAATDFDIVVQVGKRRVSVLFRPTNSHYLFRVIADPIPRSRAGAKPSPDVEFDAGTPGNAKGYEESEIRETSERLALAAVKDVMP